MINIDSRSQDSLLNDILPPASGQLIENRFVDHTNHQEAVCSPAGCHGKCHN